MRNTHNYIFYNWVFDEFIIVFLVAKNDIALWFHENSSFGLQFNVICISKSTLFTEGTVFRKLWILVFLIHLHSGIALLNI